MANYSYLSDGTKLSATNASGDGLVYMGSLVYRKRNGVLSLESVGFNGGRFVATNTGIEPRYFLMDHLGSTRVVVNNFGEVLECNDYHAYGKRWTDANSLLSDNRYGYNGKEKQDFVSLPYLDYGFRMSDPLLGRWFNLDPLSEKYYSTSPFVFCAGNPIRKVDMDGKLIDDYFNINGVYLGRDNANTDNVRIISSDNWALFSSQNQIDEEMGARVSSNVTEVQLSDDAIINIMLHYNAQIDNTDGAGDIKFKTIVTRPHTVMQYASESGFSLFGISVTTERPRIEVNIVQGKLHPLLNTGSNITNSLVHERDHHAYKGSTILSERELHAIQVQRSHKSYQNTTNEFKKSVQNYEEENRKELHHLFH